MTQPDNTVRPVYAIADAYVEDYCALDPVSATYLGVLGH